MSKVPSLITLITFLVAFFTTATSRANIVFIGVDIDIPADFTGVYIDLDEGSVTSSTTVPTSWDINFFFGGSGIANHMDLQPVKQAAADLSPVLNLTDGTLVDGTLNYGTGFGGSGASAGDSLDHMDTGTSPQPFTNGEYSRIGFSWDHDGDGGVGTADRYGWMAVTLQNDGTTGKIHGVWYESTPGLGILIPEPTSAVLLAGIGLPFLLRRRRSTKSP